MGHEVGGGGSFAAFDPPEIGGIADGTAGKLGKRPTPSLPHRLQCLFCRFHATDSATGRQNRQAFAVRKFRRVVYPRLAAPLLAPENRQDTGTTLPIGRAVNV